MLKIVKGDSCYIYIFLFNWTLKKTYLLYILLTAPSLSPPTTILPPFPSLLSMWAPCGYPDTLVLQVSARLGTSSPIEARQISLAKRTYATYKQQLLGQSLLQMFETHVKTKLSLWQLLFLITAFVLLYSSQTDIITMSQSWASKY